MILWILYYLWVKEERRRLKKNPGLVAAYAKYRAAIAKIHAETAP